jgi:hypothetical protein
MRKSRFAEEQIIALLKEEKRGCRLRIFAASTGSRITRSTTGARSMAGSRSRKRSVLKALEGENARLKKLLA